MSARWRARARRWPAARLVAVLASASLALIALAGCARDEYPQSALNPHSDFAHWIQGLNIQLVSWVVVIFLTVTTLLVTAVVRFRARPGAPEPRQVHGNTAIEIAWTLAPAVILTLVAIPTVLVIFRTQSAPPHTDLTVKVTGHQWWWEFEYPGLGIVTADEFHLPLGRTAVFDIGSADVIHSFWVPAMGGKRDAIPNHTNRMWFTPETVGAYPGQCTEFCGASHGNMRLRLFVDTPAEFAAWVANQKRPPVGGGAAAESSAAMAALAAAPSGPSPLAVEGKAVFSRSACVGCHTIQGLSAGVMGPNLTHFASRGTFAGGTFERDPENLRRWLADPPAMKPGALMPKLDLAPADIEALVAYLQSLR